MDWNDINRRLDDLGRDMSEAMQEMVERCAEYDQLVQPDPVQRCLVVRGPRLTPDQVTEIKEMLPPQVPVRFFEGMKLSTITGVTELLQEKSPHMILQVFQTVTPAGISCLNIQVTGTPLDDDIWDTIRDILKEDSYVDIWTCYMNERAVVENERVHGEGPVPSDVPEPRPIQTETGAGRDKVINDDDVVDLKIALGKTKTVEEAMDELFGGKDKDDS